MKPHFADYHMTFCNETGDKFKLPESIVGKLGSYIQDQASKVESGGVLLGRYIKESNDVVVDAITTPADTDKCGRLHFFRAERRHQQSVRQAWEASGGTCHYLGEWHTHPEQIPSSSVIDTKNWMHLLLHYRSDPDPLFFVIVGTEEIAVWQGHKIGLRLEKLLERSVGKGAS